MRGLVGDLVMKLVTDAFRKVEEEGASRSEQEKRKYGDVNPVPTHRKVRRDG